MKRQTHAQVRSCFHSNLCIMGERGGAQDLNNAHPHTLHFSYSRPGARVQFHWDMSQSLVNTINGLVLQIANAAIRARTFCWKLRCSSSNRNSDQHVDNSITCINTCLHNKQTTHNNNAAPPRANINACALISSKLAYALKNQPASNVLGP